MVNKEIAAPPGVTRDEQRWFHAMKIVADPTLSDRHRVAAIIRIQNILPAGNSIKHARPSRLLDTVLNPWDLRTYLVNGRGIELPVQRPQPWSVADLW